VGFVEIVSLKLYNMHNQLELCVWQCTFWRIWVWFIVQNVQISDHHQQYSQLQN